MPDTWPPRRPRPTPRARTALGALLAALLAGCTLPPPPAISAATAVAAASAPEAAAPPTLRVIAFNDFHGHLEPGHLSLSLADPRAPGAPPLRVAAGGAPALAGLVAALRAGAAHSVVAASGDQVGAAPLVSALFRHESTVEVLNQIGVDVATVGNHEFDAGLDELLRLLGGGCAATRPADPARSCALSPAYGGARFAVAAANVQRVDGRPLFAPHWVREVAGVRVGFIGAVTRSTPGIVVPSGVAGLRFEDEAVAVNRASAALAAQGVRAQVLLLHEGAEVGMPGQPADWNDPACPGLRGALPALLPRLDAQIDLVLSAHTHQGYNCRVDGRPLLQALSYGRGVSVADLVLDPATGDVDRARSLTRNLPVLDERTAPALRDALAAAEPPAFGAALRAARPDAAVARTVAAYAAAAAPQAQRAVGRIAAGFYRQGRTDHAAGRLVADAQWAATCAPEHGGAELALTNPGGVRADLPCRAGPCTVSYGEAFTMQPFGNSLVVMTLSGAELKTLLERQQPPGRDAPAFLQPSAGLRYDWVASAPFGQRVRALRLHGQPVRPGQPVRLTVNSYMAEGGDGLQLLKTGRERLGGPQDLDALVAHLRSGPAPLPEPRIAWVD